MSHSYWSVKYDPMGRNYRGWGLVVKETWDEPENGMTFDEWRRDLFSHCPPPVAPPPAVRLAVAVVAWPPVEWRLKPSA